MTMNDVRIKGHGKPKPVAATFMVVQDDSLFNPFWFGLMASCPVRGPDSTL